MKLKEIYVVDKRKVNSLPDFGFEFDDEDMPGFAFNTPSNEDEAIFIDLMGSYGVKGLVYWNRKDKTDDIKPHIQYLIDSCIVVKKVAEESELNI